MYLSACAFVPTTTVEERLPEIMANGPSIAGKASSHTVGKKAAITFMIMSLIHKKTTPRFMIRLPNVLFGVSWRVIMERSLHMV